MSFVSILAIGIVLAILIRTGSIGKAFGFLMRYMFFPVIFGIIGFLLLNILGLIIGAIAGLILAFVNGSKKMQGKD